MLTLYHSLEYGAECYCGNQIMTSLGAQAGACTPAQKAAQMACPGNNLEYCGGPGFMNYYYSATL